MAINLNRPDHSPKYLDEYRSAYLMTLKRDMQEAVLGYLFSEYGSSTLNSLSLVLKLFLETGKVATIFMGTYFRNIISLLSFIMEDKYGENNVNCRIIKAITQSYHPFPIEIVPLNVGEVTRFSLDQMLLNIMDKNYNYKNTTGNYLETIVSFEKKVDIDNGLGIREIIQLEAKLAKRLEQVNKLADRLELDLTDGTISFKDMLQQIVNLEGTYDPKQARVGTLLLEGIGNCEARHRLFTSLLYKICPNEDNVEIGRLSALNDVGTGHVVTVVKHGNNFFALDSGVYIIKNPEALNIKLDSPLANDYCQIAKELGYYIGVNFIGPVIRDQDFSEKNAPTTTTNSVFTLTVRALDHKTFQELMGYKLPNETPSPPGVIQRLVGQAVMINALQFKQPKSDHAVDTDVITSVLLERTGDDQTKFPREFSLNSNIPMMYIASIALIFAALVSQVAEFSNPQIVKTGKSAVKPVDIKLGRDITPPSPSYDTVQTDPKR